MASSENFAKYIFDIAGSAEGFKFRKMMGEYIIYCKGKVVGGIYDNRFLVKDTAAARKYIENPRFEIPYEGAKSMILIEMQDRDFAQKLLEETAEQLIKNKK